MKLHIIGSSSDGNGYVFEAEDGALVIEAGVPLKAIKQALGYQISKAKGCIITHEHGDHAGRVREYLADTTMPICASIGTAAALADKTIGLRQGRDIHPIESGLIYAFGAFKVIPQRLVIKDSDGAEHYTHDAAEPYCYQIHHPEMGAVLFATDTYCLPCRFAGLTSVLIECNYAQDILDKNTEAGIVDPKRRERTITSHMSLANCIHELRVKTNLADLQHIVLIHGSADNSDPDRFKAEVEAATGKRVVIAEAGMTIDLNKNPF